MVRLLVLLTVDLLARLAGLAASASTRTWSGGLCADTVASVPRRRRRWAATQARARAKAKAAERLLLYEWFLLGVSIDKDPVQGCAQD